MTQPVDPVIERLINSRDNPAVLKMGLIQMRGRCPKIPIFAVEGETDKSVYSHWVRRFRPHLRYEYFVCKNKHQVLMLHGSIQRDRTGLQKNVFFFIDRDFDDLAGVDHSEAIFMTDKYSIENYLVCEVVLDDILKIELSCNGYPELRTKLAVLFNNTYAQFLNVTSSFNFRLFTAKRFAIPRTGAFPERINQIAVISLEEVKPQIRPTEQVIELEREPTEQEIEVCECEFAELVPFDRYRGKFALLFFKRWLDLLIDDYSAKTSVHFNQVEELTRARREEIVFNSLAARSPTPIGLQEFLSSI
jgi:hypothetical protein